MEARSPRRSCCSPSMNLAAHQMGSGIKKSLSSQFGAATGVARCRARRRSWLPVATRSRARGGEQVGPSQRSHGAASSRWQSSAKAPSHVRRRSVCGPARHQSDTGGAVTARCRTLDAPGTCGGSWSLGCTGRDGGGRATAGTREQNAQTSRVSGGEVRPCREWRHPRRSDVSQPQRARRALRS